MIGSVTAWHEAVLALSLHGPRGQRDLETVIDTGFTDYLTLPAPVIQALGLERDGALLVELADGRMTYLNVFRVGVVWNDRLRTVPALESEGDPLLGMKLLRGHRMTMDIMDGGAVVINPIP